MKNLTKKSWKDVKNKNRLISFSQVFDEKYNTRAKKNKFEKDLQKFAKKCRIEILKEFGQEVRKARVKSGLTQAELANVLNTSRTAITRVENGNQNLTVEYIAKLALILGSPFEIKVPVEENVRKK